MNGPDKYGICAHAFIVVLQYRFSDFRFINATRIRCFSLSTTIACIVSGNFHAEFRLNQ